MSRSVISLGVGAVLAAGAVIVVASRLGAERPPMPPAPEPVRPVALMETTTVVVADAGFAFGDELQQATLTEATWPADAVPEGAFRTIDEILDGDVERIALRAIVAGEPVLRSKVSGFGERPTLSRQIADGKRAFAIRVDDVSGVAGFLLPGDRVDVILTRKLEDEDQSFVTDVVLQNVVVLGVDQVADQEAHEPVLARTATVEVTPTESQKLALAQRLGSLNLALRNQRAAEAIIPQRVSAPDLSSAAAAPTEMAGRVVRVRRGAADPVEERVRSW